MTSSLVGSEMCIRDSALPLPQLEPPAATILQGQGGIPPDWHIRRVIVPVSYTHLTLPTICSV
eukprot:6455301-Prorocentrum_lima.AAC.1